jgi:predicted RNA-binding protein with PUA-like domain
MPKYWLIKSEPTAYAIDALARDGRTGWEGVRNYQARNSMRDDMALGDLVLFYHSNATPTGVVGLAKVASGPYPDPSQFDRASDYYDPASTPDAPRWLQVDFAFVEKWAEAVTLPELKADPALEGMLVVRRGMRLSVQPVEQAHFDHVVALGRAKGPVQR